MSMAEASEVTSKSGVSNVIFVQVKRSSKNYKDFIVTNFLLNLKLQNFSVMQMHINIIT
jgi:hypothetical protein